MPPRGVFIIGIDGASLNVLEPHLGAGRMPNLGSFLDSGMHGELSSVCPPVSPAAWASFHTGKEPTKHGVFGFLAYDAQAGKLCFNTSGRIRGRTFWQILSDAGRRVGIVNVPMTFPPPRLNGPVISGFDTPSLASGFCHPPELKAGVLRAIPDYLFGPDQVAPDRPRFLPHLIDAGIKEFRQRVTLVELLHADERFDVFMVNFQSLDWLLHRLYLYVVEGFGSRIRKDLLTGSQHLMEALDEAVGRVLATARDYDIQLLVSDHGFTGERGRIYANAALSEWGYYFPRALEADDNSASPLRRTYRRMHDSDWRLLRSAAAAVRA